MSASISPDRLWRPLTARLLHALGMQPSLRAFLSSTSEFKRERRRIERDLRWLVAFTLYENEAASGKRSLDQDIEKWIDDADVVLGIYGASRGYVPDGRTQSMTESEYWRTLSAHRDLLAHLRAGLLQERDIDPQQRDFLRRLMDPALHRITEFHDARELIANVRKTLERWIVETLERDRSGVPYGSFRQASPLRIAAAAVVLAIAICITSAALTLLTGEHYSGLFF